MILNQQTNENEARRTKKEKRIKDKLFPQTRRENMIKKKRIPNPTLRCFDPVLSFTQCLPCLSVCWFSTLSSTPLTNAKCYSTSSGLPGTKKIQTRTFENAFKSRISQKPIAFGTLCEIQKKTYLQALKNFRKTIQKGLLPHFLLFARVKKTRMEGKSSSALFLLRSWVVPKRRLLLPIKTKCSKRFRPTQHAERNDTQLTTTDDDHQGCTTTNSNI